MSRSLGPIEAADLIERFLAGSVAPYEWDDFTSVPCADPVTEVARRRCVAVHSEHPPSGSSEYCNAKGIEVLRRIALELREFAA